MKNKRMHFDEAHYIWHDEIDSTNDEAKRQAHLGMPHKTVIAAGHQTKGKGRRGRIWESPKEDNIYMSVLLRPSFEPQYASMITLVAALSVAVAVEKCANVSCQIKWPNDLVLNKKKVCGILTEMTIDRDGACAVIVGIGVNVKNEEFPPEIREMATSLYLETGKQIDKEGLLFEIFQELEKNYEIFSSQKSLTPFLKEYNKRLINVGEQVRILLDGEDRIGIAHGIDETGALLVSDASGKMEKIISGEVSVRGLYGYV